MEKFMEFGRLQVKKICSLFFYLGSAGLLVWAIQLGRVVAIAFPYDQMVRQSDGWYTSQMSNNGLLGLLCGIVAFGLGVLLWRLVCEMLYILLCYFKNNTRQSQED